MTQKLSEKAKQNKLNYNIEYNKKIIECICGSSVRYGHLSRHKNTYKHILFLSKDKVL